MTEEKTTFKDRLLFALTGLLGPWLIRILGVLCRYRIVGEERLFRAMDKGDGAIIALWHGRMLLPVYHFRNRNISSLVSLHRDGELITRIVTRLGYIIRRGSPRQGGREGFLAMSRDLKTGETVSIFPDGPTGPRYNLRDGIIHLARISGAPIFPISFSSSPSWRIKSWDRFMIMKPFSRGIICVGAPVKVPRQIGSDEELAKHRRIIRQALIDVEREADGLMGVIEDVSEDKS